MDCHDDSKMLFNSILDFYLNCLYIIKPLIMTIIMTRVLRWHVTITRLSMSVYTGYFGIKLGWTVGIN